MTRTIGLVKWGTVYASAAVALIAGVASIGVASADLPSDAAIRQMLVTRIDVQHRGTGAIVAIVTPKETRQIAYGTQATGSTSPVNGDTVFRVQSVTKVFTALLLADTARRGQVRLDDPVARYLPVPGARLPAHGGKQISLADLATHTSGLPLRPSNLVSKDPDNKYDGYTPALLYAFLSSYELALDPGSRYEYSNVGYGVLGQALQEAAGMSYGELVRQRITEPLGLRSTGLTPTPAMAGRSATGYATDGRSIAGSERGALDASGALYSSTNDLLRLLEVCLGYRKSELAQDVAITVQTRRPGGQMPSTETGLGWNILRVDNGEIVYKNGAGSGFRSFIGYNAATGVGVVGLINVESDVGMDDIGLNLLGAAFPIDMHVPRVHTEVAIDPRLLDSYVGSYRFSDTDLMEITRDGDRLFCQQIAQPGAPKLELHPEGAGEFFLKEVDAEISFESPAGQPATAMIWRQWGQDQRGDRAQ